MCRCLFDADTPVGKEVITDFREDFSLVRIMTEVLESMTKEEVKLLKSRAIGKKWLLDEDKLAQETCKSKVFPSLEWVVGWQLEFSWQYEVQKKRIQMERARQRKRLRSFY